MLKLKTRFKQELRKHQTVWRLLYNLRSGVREFYHEGKAKRHQRAGNLLAVKGDFETAIGRYRQAITFRPELFIPISSHLVETLKNWGSNNLKRDELVSSLIPDIAEVYFKIGNALEKEGRFEEAIKSYQRAIALDPELLESNYRLLWEVYDKFVKVAAPEIDPDLDFGPDQDFALRGFKQGTLPQEEVTAFRHSLKNAPEQLILQEDAPPGYVSHTGLKQYEKDLNSSHTHLSLGSEQLRRLSSLLQALAKPIAKCIGTPWRVVNVRCFKTHSWAVETGPNEWHTDGFPLCVKKFLIYLSEVGAEKGTTELKFSDGSIASVTGPDGTWLLFRNSEILHRGVAPIHGERFALEITIVPSLINDQRPVCPGLNANYPKLPWSGTSASIYDSINLGGGPFFHHPGWLNLEGVASNINTYPFEFHPECEFPIGSDSVNTVYTSHALEHLDTPTIFRVLTEAHRVLRGKGRLIIKIPDFDRALDCWIKKDESYFTDEMWYLSEVVQTWHNRRIPDSIDYRAAFIFCGFWNDAYGDHFSRQINWNEDAYHGPAVVEVEFLKNLINNCTPSQISASLRKAVVEHEESYHFNHQNAWGSRELEKLLKESGFRVKSFDKDFIVANCADIPGIDLMKEQSLYCWAEKV
jgi:tetratricopeptide (TPR) repeat protein